MANARAKQKKHVSSARKSLTTRGVRRKLMRRWAESTDVPRKPRYLSAKDLVAYQKEVTEMFVTELMSNLNKNKQQEEETA